MLFLIVFLAGMCIGAGLCYHFTGVAALKWRLAELERNRPSDTPPQ